MKLLITGASGFLSYHLLRIVPADWEVYAFSHSHVCDFKNATSIQCELTNYIELGNYFDDIEPDAVIHTAAISDANFCQNNKALSYSINVEATKNLAGICCDFQIPLAFTSTDLVFDGKQGMYQEGDAKNPVSVYGEQKSEAEDELLKIYPEATVFRLPLMFGYPEASEGNFTSKFISQLKKGESFNLFNDEYRSACGAKSISEGILKLFQNTSGIIHLAAKEKISRYDLGVEMVKAFELPLELIRSCSQKDVKLAAPRPADVSLDISKAVSLGYAPMGVSEELGLIGSGEYF